MKTLPCFRWNIHSCKVPSKYITKKNSNALWSVNTFTFFKILKIILVGKGPTYEGPQMSLPLFIQTTTFTHNELTPTCTMKNGWCVDKYCAVLFCHLARFAGNDWVYGPLGLVVLKISKNQIWPIHPILYKNWKPNQTYP